MTLNCNINICLHSKQAQGKLLILVLYAVGFLQLTIGAQFYNLVCLFCRFTHEATIIFFYDSKTFNLTDWRRIGHRIGYLIYYISSSTVVSHNEFPRCIEYKLHFPGGISLLPCHLRVRKITLGRGRVTV